MNVSLDAMINNGCGPAALLADSGFVHEGSYHIHCDEAMLDLHDGIPKFMGWPDSEPMEEPLQTRMRPSAT